MAEYALVRSEGRTFLFAKECDYSSQIEIDTALFSPEELLLLMKENEVAPEHLQNVYDDLLFKKNMV